MPEILRTWRPRHTLRRMAINSLTVFWWIASLLLAGSKEVHGTNGYWLRKAFLANKSFRSSQWQPIITTPTSSSVERGSVNWRALLRSKELIGLFDEVDMEQFVLGDGFKGILATVVDSPLIPDLLQPSVKKISPYLPNIISNYYGCGGETKKAIDALNSVLDNPLLEPLISNASLLEETLSDATLVSAALPTLYSSLVNDNPPAYDWLSTLQIQCIVDGGYIQPAAVLLGEDTAYEAIAEQIPKLVDDYYNTGCTTEQMLAFVPVFLEAQALPPAQQTTTLFQKSGTTPEGKEVRLTSQFGGGPSLLQCITPNLAVLAPIFVVG